ALGGNSYSNFYGAAIFGGGLELDNCLIANNTTDNNLGRMSCAGGTLTGKNDLQWPKNKVAGGGADTDCLAGITYADPMLGALGNNGGSTLTLAPAAAATVVQTGSNCPMIDQTGKARKTPCTLGALEL
ncbi:MAG TPA: choice-of-anchor Q domain-containing protein, partial [Polyangiaceae bacterium]